MIENMGRVHMTESEVASNFAAVLEKIRAGNEVIVEHDHRPVARITPVRGPGRPIAECIAIAKARGSKATMDEDFAQDLEEIIANRQPLDTSAWE